MRLTTQKQKDDNRNAQVDLLKEKYNAKVQRVYDIIIVSYESQIGNEIKPLMKVWKEKAAHTFANHYYMSEAGREEAKAVYVGAAERRTANKAERKREKDQFKHDLKVGDILYSSWGYDQTNIDFYQVIKTTGKSVLIQEIKSDMIDTTGYDSGKVVPVKDSFVEKEKAMMKRVQKGNYIRIASFALASPWDGQPCHCSWGH